LEIPRRLSKSSLADAGRCDGSVMGWRAFRGVREHKKPGRRAAAGPRSSQKAYFVMPSFLQPSA
jgi:hypothetical protein